MTVRAPVGSAHHRTALRASLAIALLAMRPCPATATDAGAIAWGHCPEAWTGTPSGVLGDRLQCATLVMPLDHAATDGPTTEVGVVRIRAARAEQRQGAIFFNRGGPGSHPGRLLRSLAEAWTRSDVGDPDEVDKRRLAERFDLVAVIPRGLLGSRPLTCLTGLPPRFAFLPTHQDDANWRTAVDEAEDIARTCTAQAGARYANTEQHVHDMDRVRELLGDERLHFYGISYGGKVGAWYAAMYPTHTGRLLLDSSMDFMRDVRGALQLTLQARQAAFATDVVAVLAADPATYGLPGDADDVATAIENLHPDVRAVVALHLDSPLRTAAALRIGAWFDVDRPADLRAMTQRIARTRFSPDPGLDGRIRWEATQMARAILAPPRTQPVFDQRAEGDAVRIVVSCNDARWDRDEAAMRRSLAQDALRYMRYSGDEVFEELICSRWGGASAREPVMAPLERAAPFLFIQSEKDTSTPLAGAHAMLGHFPNARMLLVKGSDLHGVFNFTTSGCIERTAARYLLTGELPESPSRAFACTGIFDNPADVLPGSPRPPSEPPVPVAVPGIPVPHDEN